MCLRTVTWQAENKKNWKQPVKWQVGYKVFKRYKYDEGLETERTEILFPHFHEPFEFNKVLKAKPEKIMRYNGVDKDYMSGFHIFPTAVAASLYLPKFRTTDYLYMKVEYRKVSATGTHDIYTDYPTDCIIAQEMKVIGEVTEPIQEPKNVRRDDPNSYRVRRRRNSLRKRR